MARAAVKAKHAARPKPKPQGRRRHAGGGNPNQQLFFVRIRRRQKWVFAFLAGLFALTFAFLGVGTGTSGLDQLFSNINIFGSGGGPSVSHAQAELRKDPGSAKGFRDLATAYENKGDTANAISALQQYTTIRPKDAKAWTELAGLQATQAQDYLTQYQNAYQLQQLASPSQPFLPSGKLGTAIGTDPIESAQSSAAQQSVSDLQSKVQVAYTSSVNSWRQLTKLQPRNANVWFEEAQAAQTAGDTTTAVQAYKQYLKLDPTSSSAAQVRALIKQLQPAPAPAPKPKKKK